MKYLLQAAVLLLMLAVGISLRPGQIWNNWRRLTLWKWARLIAATFLLPPTLALALGNLFALGGPATAGLFLIGAVPGAPFMTRGAAQRGFDVQMAASYQVWSGLLTPVIVPLLVATGGWLYGRNIWVPPMKLLTVIAQQQFLPLLVGMALMWLAPAFSKRLQRGLVPIGNFIILVVLVAVLYKMGPALEAGEPVAGGGGAASRDRMSLRSASATRRTLPNHSDVIHLQREPPHWSRAFAFRAANAGQPACASDRGLCDRSPARDGRLREARAGCEGNAGDLSLRRQPGSAAIFVRCVLQLALRDD